MHDPDVVLRRAAPVLPQLRLQSLDEAIRYGEFFAEAGVPVVELSVGHRDTWKMLKQLRNCMPGALVGVGNVLRRPDMLRAADEADFVSSPGFSSELANIARKTLLAYLPGIATATEVMAVLAADQRAMKFFPAPALGGVSMLHSFASAFPDVQFCPSGGIDAENYQEYLALDAVACVAGEWLIPSVAQLEQDRDGCVERLKSICQRR